MRLISLWQAPLLCKQILYLSFEFPFSRKTTDKDPKFKLMLTKSVEPQGHRYSKYIPYLIIFYNRLNSFDFVSFNSGLINELTV